MEMKEIEQLLALKFQKKQGAVSKIILQERRLRAQLSRLDEQARTAETSQHQYLQAIGADVIWNAWLGRTKTSLNLELAQVLAQKEMLLQDARKDYGKLLVSRELMQNQAEIEQKKGHSKLLGTAINNWLFK
ncbi:hypothetical protein [Roseobacter weihaiensis]|uniref:hypothetical protein n=1 Tax=Roseobacter weihaiensis TaxID=2763262 RepID=UPI001D0A1B90|nr:hypothetical protein [Roseobacter sp. H9]